jgi:hypothetical protein
MTACSASKFSLYREANRSYKPTIRLQYGAAHICSIFINIDSHHVTFGRYTLKHSYGGHVSNL